MLIFFPQSKFCGYLIISIFPYLIFSAIYVYLIYYFFVAGYDFLNNFSLYLSLENLSSLFLKEFYKKFKTTFAPGLENNDLVKSYSLRTILAGMGSTAHGAQGIHVIGIDPDHEKEISYE